MDAVYYPVNDFGPLMKGLAIGGLGIFHVFTAQFAIGGGFLLAWFQWRAMTDRCPECRLFIHGYFRFLVLVSFVTGALTGVGMWFTSIQVSPQTIALMVDEFHWLWAVEWTFFTLEVVAGYAAYRYGARLSDSAYLILLLLYAFAAWMSLFWINGILSFQLTPGRWLETGGLWAGFFNPTFWPSLLYRTVACGSLAALVAMLVVNLSNLPHNQKTTLIREAAWFTMPMLLMPFLGIWFVSVLPPDSREWITGGSVAMTMFLGIAVGASVVIAGYCLIGILRQRLTINGATATVLCLMAFAATAGGEFVREGARKPYTLREILYSNAIRPDQVKKLREVGVTTGDPYPLRGADGLPNEQTKLGALAFRNLCSICHTVNGVNSLPGLTASWDTDMKRMNIAKLQYLKPFMPPFAGTPEELEGLVQYVEWIQAGSPRAWPDSLADPQTRTKRLAEIGRALDQAGVEAYLHQKRRKE